MSLARIGRAGPWTAAALLLVGCGAAAAPSEPPQPRDAASAAASAQIVSNPLPEGTLIGTLPSDLAEPLGLHVLADGLAVETVAEIALLRTDSSEVTERIRLPEVAQVNALLLTQDSLWVTDHDNGAVIRVDRATSDELARIELPRGRAVSLVEADGLIWAGGGHELPEFVMGIDPATNEPVRTIEQGAWPTSDGEFLWFGRDADHVASTVRKVDPGSGDVVSDIDLAGAEGCYVGGSLPDVMWSWCFEPWPDNTVAARLEPAAARVAAEVPLGGSGGLIGVADGSSWFFADRSDGLVLLKVPNETNEITDAWALSASSAWVIHKDTLWLLDLEDHTLTRLALEEL